MRRQGRSRAKTLALSGANAFGQGFYGKESRYLFDGARVLEWASRVPQRGTRARAHRLDGIWYGE